MIEAANRGRVAQLGEHLLCKQGVTGSIPVTSTKFPGYLLVFREVEASLPASFTSV